MPAANALDYVAAVLTCPGCILLVDRSLDRAPERVDHTPDDAIPANGPSNDSVLVLLVFGLIATEIASPSDGFSTAATRSTKSVRVTTVQAFRWTTLVALVRLSRIF